MNTSVVTSCPVHGADVEPFEIAGTRFCALCVRDHFLQVNHIHELEMIQIEVEPKAKQSETAFNGER